MGDEIIIVWVGEKGRLCGGERFGSWTASARYHFYHTIFGLC